MELILSLSHPLALTDFSDVLRVWLVIKMKAGIIIITVEPSSSCTVYPYNTFVAELLWVLLNYYMLCYLYLKSIESLKLSSCLLHSHVW